MAADDTKLLTKVNLNGTELIIGDAKARQAIIDSETTVRGLSTAVENLELKSRSLITATYDEQSSTLSLTSES